MSVTGITGIVIPAGGDAVNVPSSFSTMEASINRRIVAFFSTTAARDSSYAALSSAQKTGIKCWVDERKGHYTFNGTAWVPDPQRNLLVDIPRNTAAQANGGTPVSIILGGALVLPAGNRRIKIHAKTNMSNPVTPSPPAVSPRAVVTGPGMPDGPNWLQAFLPAGSNFTETRGDTWEITASGTCQWDLVGVNATTGVVQFDNSILQITDLGPAD